MADVLADALAKHLCELDGCSDPAPCLDHITAASSALKFLANHSAILPPGITIGAVYRVTRRGSPDGYQFTDRREAVDHARFGGTDGRVGAVETAWRIRADGVDVTSMWGRTDG